MVLIEHTRGAWRSKWGGLVVGGAVAVLGACSGGSANDGAASVPDASGSAGSARSTAMSSVPVDSSTRSSSSGSAVSRDDHTVESLGEPASILVDVDDLPEGWASLDIDASIPGGGDDTCLDEALVEVVAVVGEGSTSPTALAGFASPDFATVLEVAVATEVDDAASIVDGVVDGLVACDGFVDDEGSSYAISSAELSVVGDDVAAVRLVARDDDSATSFSSLAAWAHVGHVFIQASIVGTTPDALDAALLEDVTRTMIERADGTSSSTDADASSERGGAGGPDGAEEDAGPDTARDPLAEPEPVDASVGEDWTVVALEGLGIEITLPPGSGVDFPTTGSVSDPSFTQELESVSVPELAQGDEPGSATVTRYRRDDGSHVGLREYLDDPLTNLFSEQADLNVFEADGVLVVRQQITAEVNGQLVTSVAYLAERAEDLYSLTLGFVDDPDIAIPAVSSIEQAQ